MKIIAALTAPSNDAQMEFVALRDLLKVTDGNLSVHLRKLEEAGYVSIEKAFIARKPRTYIARHPEDNGHSQTISPRSGRS